MDEIVHIREAERKYHEHCYDNYKLFEEGSWLHKPVKTVMDLCTLFEGKGHLEVLDLGCGVGRNSIPLAEKIKGVNGNVVCVDLLEVALSKLAANSMEHGVEAYIEPILSDIGEYTIKKDRFDFIVAVSSLEHVKSQEILVKVLKEMANGTKDEGIVCIILNSNVRERELLTGQSLKAMIEVNMTTEQCMELLHSTYVGWEILKSHVKTLEFQIDRDGIQVVLSTDCITFVVRKSQLDSVD